MTDGAAPTDRGWQKPLRLPQNSTRDDEPPRRPAHGAALLTKLHLAGTGRLHHPCQLQRAERDHVTVRRAEGSGAAPCSLHPKHRALLFPALSPVMMMKMTDTLLLSDGGGPDQRTPQQEGPPARRASTPLPEAPQKFTKALQVGRSDPAPGTGRGHQPREQLCRRGPQVTVGRRPALQPRGPTEAGGGSPRRTGAPCKVTAISGKTVAPSNIVLCRRR